MVEAFSPERGERLDEGDFVKKKKGVLPLFFLFFIFL
jgi:hypothetical protein